MSEQTDPKTLLVSAKTDGLNVHSRDGDNLGHVHAFMVDKRSGQASFVVLTLGGFLGLGKSFYPLPFEMISYDAVEDHYIVTIDRRLLEGGPSWANNAPGFNQAYADRVSSYYGSEAVNVSIV